MLLGLEELARPPAGVGVDEFFERDLHGRAKSISVHHVGEGIVRRTPQLRQGVANATRFFGDIAGLTTPMCAFHAYHEGLPESPDRP